MKNNNQETITETLKKCRIIYDFVAEDINKVLAEELLRENIRKEREIEICKQRQNVFWCDISGIVLGCIIILAGTALTSMGIRFVGIFLVTYGSIKFLINIGTVIMMTFCFLLSSIDRNCKT